ncbi:MAG: biotin/lipoyl-containing protein, partial [Ramlibacter sp.]
GERDCSVQRRHQKIIEETPSPAVDPDLRARMGRCAVELAQAAGYVGAGTVEFLLEEGEASTSPNFFLMEMNTRLQVEHPVTEAVTGLDLVEWQLRVARGEALPLTQEQLRLEGHAIEVRLCAEDDNFTPHAGTVLHFRPPCGLRFDHALFEGLEVPPYYDSMLGKLVAHAPTREQAIDQLAGALDRLELLGLPSNRRLLAACLRHPEFRAGRALVPFLARHGDALREVLQKEEQAMATGCALAALFPLKRAMELVSPFERPVRLRHRGETTELRVREADGVAAMAGPSVRLPDGRWHAQAGRVDLFFEDASFEPPGGAAGGAGGSELRAPFNGKVIAVQAEAGRTVLKGDTLLVLESMKLEHALSAPRAGVVQSVEVAAGQQVATSQVLVVFEVAS